MNFNKLNIQEYEVHHKLVGNTLYMDFQMK